jgi:AraC family transcriptional regulator of adaptative response/methylated-DNA-[protein]-cysteine methyltransferase
MMSAVMTKPHTTIEDYASDAARRRALRARERNADGHFLYAVKTTGIYCRPSCAARAARPENVAFFDGRVAAELAGYRPCKRCRPDLAPKPQRETALVADSCRAIETAEEAPSLKDLAAAAGLSPHHFHRLFKRIAGVTPAAYFAARRQSRVKARLAAGDSVTAALYDAGFNSSGRFYTAAPAMLGMTPSAFKQGGKGEAIRYAVARCGLGFVLVAVAQRGICAILLGDAPDDLAADLAARFPKATMAPAEPDFARLVARVVRLIDAPECAPDAKLPLDIRGTAFQRRVWQALQEIPAGETASYAVIARKIGKPSAVRAVAGACAANRLAVAIPCHRAIAADGSLSGYRWGIERKRRLLTRERATKK